MEEKKALRNKLILIREEISDKKKKQVSKYVVKFLF